MDMIELRTAHTADLDADAKAAVRRAGAAHRVRRGRRGLIRMRVREVLADVSHVDLPCMTGVVVVVHPGGDQALPGYLEMRAHENGAVRAYVPGNREYPQLPEPG